MDELISLAIYVGKLEARVEALEKQNSCAAPVSLSFTKEDPEKGKLREPEEDPDEARLMMEGFNNIMDYSWPPKKKDGEE